MKNKFYKTKTTKLPIANKKAKTVKFKKHKVLGVEKSLVDKTGTAYQLFAQDPIEYYRDFRVNNPKIGIIVNGVFWSIGTVESSLVKLAAHFETINAVELAESFLDLYKVEVSNEK